MCSGVVRITGLVSRTVAGLIATLVWGSGSGLLFILGFLLGDDGSYAYSCPGGIRESIHKQKAHKHHYYHQYNLRNPKNHSKILVFHGFLCGTYVVVYLYIYSLLKKYQTCK